MLIADFIISFSWASSCIGVIWISPRISAHNTAGPFELGMDQLHHKVNVAAFISLLTWHGTTSPGKLLWKLLWLAVYGPKIPLEPWRLIVCSGGETSNFRYRYSKILEKNYSKVWVLPVLRRDWRKDSKCSGMQIWQGLRSCCNHKIHKILVKSLK